jgi:hypothetical protein
MNTQIPTNKNQVQELRIIDNLLGFISHSVEFKEKPFFSLKPNTLITQIGCGKENGTIRTSNFEPFVIYKGSIVFNEEELFAFEIPHSKGSYFLFGKSNEEVFTEAFYSVDKQSNQIKTYMRFYKPIFKIFNENATI